MATKYGAMRTAALRAVVEVHVVNERDNYDAAEHPAGALIAGTIVAVHAVGARNKYVVELCELRSDGTRHRVETMYVYKRRGGASRRELCAMRAGDLVEWRCDMRDAKGRLVGYRWFPARFVCVHDDSDLVEVDEREDQYRLHARECVRMPTALADNHYAPFSFSLDEQAVAAAAHDAAAAATWCATAAQDAAAAATW